MPENKRFRLKFVNAAEDVPRIVRAYGRACDGEFALVMRPPEERAVLVLVTKKDGARFWRSGDHAPDGRPPGPDAPDMPEYAITPTEAVTLVKTAQKAVPKPGPITLRGQWTGWVECDGRAPRVELVRKLAAYGVLRIVSSPTGWAWTVERTEKWFSKPGSDTGTAPTLLKAIEAGLARGMGLIGEACSVRDSRRRAALDTAYAVEHPVKPAKEGKDPIERLKEPRGKAAASGWTRFEGEPPESDPIDRPTKAVLARVRAGGLAHDAGAGTYLARTVVAFGEFPVGAVVFRAVEDAGFWLHAPVEARPRKPKADVAPAKPRVVEEPGVDAAKDKALLDAFSSAITAALSQTA